jgi:hypothetical protein
MNFVRNIKSNDKMSTIINKETNNFNIQNNDTPIFKQESYIINRGNYVLFISLCDSYKISYNEIKEILEKIFKDTESLKNKNYDFKFNFDTITISVNTNSFIIISEIKNKLEEELKKILNNKDIFL